MPDVRSGVRTAIVLSVIGGLFSIPIALVPSTRSLAARNHDDLQVNAQITFQPSLPTLVFHTEVPPLFAILTVQAIPISLETDGLYSPTFREVACGLLRGEKCYELCYGGVCHIYGGDDQRVEDYVELVKQREQLIQDFRAAKREIWPGILAAFGKCAQAAGGGAVVYGLLVAGATYAGVSPEPSTKTAAAVLTAVGATALCGSSIWSDIVNVFVSANEVQDDALSASRNAVLKFRSLEGG